MTKYDRLIGLGIAWLFASAVVPTLASAASVDEMCPTEMAGAKYDLTDSDWEAMVEGVGHLKDIETDEIFATTGFFDMTNEGEPFLAPPDSSGIVLRAMVGAEARVLDLNGDGEAEVVVVLSSPMTCSNGVATCSILVLDASRPRQVLLESSGHCLVLDETSHFGWMDISIHWLGSDYSSWQAKYTFDGSKYSHPIRQEIGKLKMNG